MARHYQSNTSAKQPLLFGMKNYLFVIAGLALVIIGFLLMAGGTQPDPNTWQAEEIYSSRRITLAPLVVILGLGVIVVAIFIPSGKGGDTTDTDLSSLRQQPNQTT